MGGKLTAAQRRYNENALLISALTLIFQKLFLNFESRQFGDIAETTSGGTPSRNISHYYGGDIPWMKSGELTDGIITKVEEFITQEGLKNSSAKIFPKGTLVVALYGATVGKTGILGIDTASNQAVCAVFPKSGLVLKEFLFWFLRYKRPEFLGSSFGGAQPNISQKLLRETEVPVPPKDLQETICKFMKVVENRQNGDKSNDYPALPTELADVRRIVRRIEALVGRVAEAQSLRREASEETKFLVSSGQTHIFENSYNHSWGKSKLREVAVVARGKFSHRPRNEPRFFGGSIPFIQIGDISNSNRYIQKHSQTLNEEGLNISRLFHKGTIVIAITGATIGVTGILDIDACFPDSIVGIIAQPEIVLPEFLYWAIEHTKQKALEQATHTTQPNINLRILDTLTIPVPPLEEQRRLVAYLDGLQAQVSQLRRYQEETQKELEAMMPSILDKAFRGEL